MNTTIRFTRNLHHSLNAVRFNTTKIALVDAKALYGELATKASKNLPLALGDLKKVLDSCKKSKDFPTALKATTLYQKAGNDFSEETCSLFVKIALESDKLNTASTLLLTPSYRLFSWVGKENYVKILDTLIKAQNVVDVAKYIKLSQQKGLGSLNTPAIFENALKASVDANNADSHKDILEVANSVLDKKTSESLASKFPLAAAPAEPAAAN